MLGIDERWSGGIDALVTEANRLLAQLLPGDRAARLKDEMNPRLVRHYTTVGLLPAPTREGREARYGRGHLLGLLALRRLMADGLSGKALVGALIGAASRSWRISPGRASPGRIPRPRPSGCSSHWPPVRACSCRAT